MYLDRSSSRLRVSEACDIPRNNMEGIKKRAPPSVSRMSTSATHEFPATASRHSTCDSQCSWEDLQQYDSHMLDKDQWEGPLASSLASVKHVGLLRQVINGCSRISVTLQAVSLDKISPPITAVVSKNFESLSGYPAWELEGKSQRMLAPEQDVHAESCVQSVMLSGKPANFLEVLTTREGMKVVTQRHCRPMKVSMDETADVTLLLNVHLDLQADEEDSLEDLGRRARNTVLIERLGNELSGMISDSLAAQTIVE